MKAPDRSGIGGRAAGAGAWTVGTRLVAKLIDLVMLLCLARFLGPAEFGLVAIAMAAVFIVEALFELPMVAALIRVPTLNAEMLHTAFTLSLLRGLLIAAILLAVSWPMAVFNDEPRLTGLIAMLALAPVLRGLVSPRMVVYARAFNFRPDAAIELSGKVVAFTVSIGIALLTQSYWAIAAATVCAPLVTTLLSYCVAPLRPRLTLNDWRRFSNLIGWNFVAQFGSALNWQIDRLLLPRFSATAAFGQYAMAKQLAEIPTQALIQPLSRPIMAVLAAEGDMRTSRYLHLAHAIALLMVPVLAVLMLWPGVAVHLTLGAQWSAATEWLQWISAVALLGMPGLMLGPLAMTLDQTRWLAIRTFFELAVRVPVVWAGAAQFGIIGAIAGSAIATLAGALVALFIVRRLLGIGILRQLAPLVTPFAALVPAGFLLWSSLPAVLAAQDTLEMAVRALFFGSLYLFFYATLVLLAWAATGRPFGIEQLAVKLLRANANRALAYARRMGTKAARSSSQP